MESDDKIRGVVLVRIPNFEGLSVIEKLQIPVGNSQIDEVPINTNKPEDDDEDDDIIDILGDTPVKNKNKKDNQEEPDLLGNWEGSEEENSDQQQ